MREDMASPYYVGKGHSYRCYDKRKGSQPPNDRNRIRKVAEGLTEADAFALERLLIQFYGRKSDGGILINITEGGEGTCGMKHTEESKAKMSAAQKGNKSRLGAVLTEETKEKIRKSKLGSTPWNKGRSGYKTQPASDARKAKVGKRVIIEGVEFPTISAAARHYGLSQPGVRARLQNPAFTDWKAVL